MRQSIGSLYRQRTMFTAAIALVFTLVCGAQTLSVSPSVLTNKDVIVLAGAGFSEGFILDTIAGSQSRFDTTSNGLADLAKHAISERIIRAMMEQAAQPSQAAAGFVTVQSDAPTPVVMPSPEGGAKLMRAKTAKPSTVSMAVSAGTPYYEWKSVFWGLWKKRVGVAPAPNPSPVATPHLGSLFQQVRAPQPQQYVRTLAPQAYPFEPMTYYVVAPR